MPERAKDPPKPIRTFKSVSYSCAVKEMERNGAYEGMVVVIALLSQEDVEGHQSVVMPKGMIGSLASNRKMMKWIIRYYVRVKGVKVIWLEV